MPDINYYWPGDSLWHRLDPRSKMLAGFFICLLLLQTRAPLILLALVLLTVCCLLVSRVPAGVYYRSFRIFLIIIFASMGFNYLAAMHQETAATINGIAGMDCNALVQSAMLGARIACIILIMLLFSFTTSPVALINSAARIFNPLEKIGLPAGELQMIMFIAYRFLPLLMRESQNIREAQLCRGIDISTGPPFQRVKKRLALIVPLMHRALLGAEQLAESMEARAYIPGQVRSSWRFTGFNTSDYIVIGFSIIIFLGLGFQ